MELVDIFPSLNLLLRHLFPCPPLPLPPFLSFQILLFHIPIFLNILGSLARSIERSIIFFFRFYSTDYHCKSMYLCGLSQIQMRVRESSLNERYTGEYASQSRSTFLPFSRKSRAPFVFPYPLFPLPPFLSSQTPPFLVPIFSNLPVLFAWFIERWIGFFGFWLIYPRKSMHFCGEIIFSLLIYYSLLWVKESSLLRNFRNVDCSEFTLQRKCCWFLIKRNSK